MSSITIDNEADVAAVDLVQGAIARTEEVGSSLLANYGHDGMLMSVDILSLKALRRADVVGSLRELLATADAPQPVLAASSACPRAGRSPQAAARSRGHVGVPGERNPGRRERALCRGFGLITVDVHRARYLPGLNRATGAGSNTRGRSAPAGSPGWS